MDSSQNANRFLEAGVIVGTHGVRGEVKLKPSCDSAEFLMPLKTLYQNGEPIQPLAKRVHKGMLLLLLPGYDTVEKAMRLIQTKLYFDRADVKLPKGVYFCCDLVGLDVFDQRLEKTIGKIAEVLDRPASNVYVVCDENKEYLIPAAGDFIQSIDLKSGVMTVRTIPGMVDDE